MSKVTWDEEVCIHSGNCVRGLPTVFKIEDDKFVIDESAASEDDIKKIIARCPSGALKYHG